MRTDLIKCSLGALAISILAACGGTANVPGGTSYLTNDPAVDEPGESVSINLTGTANVDGVTASATASASITQQPNQTLGGEDVTVTDLLVVADVPGQMTTVDSGTTIYVGLDGVLRQLDTSGGLICMPAAGYGQIPASVAVGDSGDVGIVDCNDGTTISESYLVETSDRNSSWAAIRVYTLIDSPSEAYANQEIVYHVNADGETQAVDWYYHEGNLIIDLAS